MTVPARFANRRMSLWTVAALLLLAGGVCWLLLRTRSRSKAEWAEWQERMKVSFRDAKSSEMDPAMSGKARADAWKGFLTEYAEDNPNSHFDDSMREFAEEQHRYWVSYGDPPPTPVKGPQTLTVLGTPAKPPAPGRAFTNAIGIDFAWVPPGEFRMGSPEDEPGRLSDERLHVVRISRGYWLARHEVTQEQWEAVLGHNPAVFKGCGKRCPVDSVSWEDAQEFIRMLNALEGTSTYRLPNEAEWEHAARAGSNQAIPTGELSIAGRNNGPELDAIAWYGGNSGVEYEGGFECSALVEKQYPSTRCGPHPVGRKRANRLGLFDMLGNVREWVLDPHGDYPMGPAGDPVGVASMPGHTVRGCSWFNEPVFCRSAARTWVHTQKRVVDVGFRVARSL